LFQSWLCNGRGKKKKKKRRGVVMKKTKKLGRGLCRSFFAVAVGGEGEKSTKRGEFLKREVKEKKSRITAGSRKGGNEAEGRGKNRKRM